MVLPKATLFFFFAPLLLASARPQPRTPGSATTSPATDDGYGFKDLGCYSDSANSPALSFNAGYAPPHVNGWPQYMCRERCMSKNFKYYGLESGWQCHCGNEIKHNATSGQQIPRSQCNTPCIMDKTSTCGGTNAIEIFYNKNMDTTPSRGYALVGCYTDSSDNRLLQTNVGSAPSGTTGWSFETCAAECQKRDMGYAGLEAGNECWCGGTFVSWGSDSGKKVDDSECAKPCPGNSTQTCGDNWRMRVFLNKELDLTTHW